MKLITLDLPLSDIKKLSVLSWEWGASRAELIRIAIRDLLTKELSPRNSNRIIVPSQRIIVPSQRIIIPSQSILIDNERELNFYRYCISCNNKIHNSKAPYRHENKFEIIELRFCCDCYKKFENTSIEGFPESILDNVQNKLEKYKESLKRR